MKFENDDWLTWFVDSLILGLENLGELVLSSLKYRPLALALWLYLLLLCMSIGLYADNI